MATPIKEDEIVLGQLEELLRNPTGVCHITKDEIDSIVRFCVKRLHRFRMGGRSSCLAGLSIVLWYAHDRADTLEVDIEECLALAFRTTIDPTFVQPEWGVVLAGVIIAKHLEGFSEELKKEIGKQSRLILRYLESRSANKAVRAAASALLMAWDGAFPKGLNPVIKAGLEAWPRTTAGSEFANDRIERLMDELSEVLPVEIVEREQLLYRLSLERQGKWQLFESISLCENTIG